MWKHVDNDGEGIRWPMHPYPVLECFVLHKQKWQKQLANRSVMRSKIELANY